MRIKKFIAGSIKDGKALVIKELGDDAVILSSRTTKNPSTGEDIVEIVAALDESPQAKKPTLPVFPKKEDINNSQSDETKQPDSIYQEMLDIKRNINDLVRYVKYKYSGSLSPAFSKLYQTLIDNELSEDIAMEIVGRVSAININAEYSTAVEFAKEILEEKIDITEPISESKKQNVILFVGTTGSGKTSSLVKIAVICKLLLKSNILIISADTYKVGGAEQLQTMSSIVGISYKSVYSASELKSEIESEKTRDLIFIDTTGRSHKDPEFIEELKEYYEGASPDTTYLVINATNSKSTTKEIIGNLAFVNPSSVVLTKVDEAAALGAVVSAISEAGLPISYISNGQKIPDHIEPANKIKIVDDLLKNIY